MLSKEMFRQTGRIEVCESCRARYTGRHIVSRYSPEREEDGKRTRNCIYCGLGVSEDI